MYYASICMVPMLQTCHQFLSTKVWYCYGGCWNIYVWVITNLLVIIGYVFNFCWSNLYFIHAAILHFPAIHKKKPQRSGYRRAKINRKMTLFGW